MSYVGAIKKLFPIFENLETQKQATCKSSWSLKISYAG